MLQLLMSYCVGTTDNVGVDYVKFANFLNWKDKTTLPVELVSTTETPPTLSKQIDQNLTNHKTSASVIGALSSVSTGRYTTYGTPTVRTDLAAPTLKRVSDNKNYGDESDANGLINPNTYAKYGLSERDFFMARPADEIKRIFFAVGVTMSEETFGEAWRRAKSCDPRKKGEVSVETFRSVLDDAQAMQIESA